MNTKHSNDPFTAGINYLGLNPAMQTKDFTLNIPQHYKTGEFVYHDDYSLPNNAVNNNSVIHPRRSVHSYGFSDKLSTEQIDHISSTLNKNAHKQITYSSLSGYDTSSLVNL